MNVDELYIFVKEYYGYKAQMLSYNSETKEVECLLYDSFCMKCGVNVQNGRFGAEIETGGKFAITEFLGKKCSVNSDKESIKNSLKIIDEYCRLRLPDRFLDAYCKNSVTDEYENSNL